MTRSFERMTHAVVPVLQLCETGFLGKDLNVAIRGKLGRVSGLWRRTDGGRYTCVLRLPAVLVLQRRGIGEL